MTLYSKESELKTIKAKKNKSINGIENIIKFIIAMLVIRGILMIIITTNTDMSFKELYFSRFYSSSTNISMFNFYDKNPFWISILSIPMPNNIFLQLISLVLTLIIGIIILIVSILLMPTTYMMINVVSIIDTLAPTHGNIIMWWMLFSLIAGVILNKISKHWISSIIIIAILGIVLVIPIRKHFSEKVVQESIQYYDIKEFFKLPEVKK